MSVYTFCTGMGACVWEYVYGNVCMDVDCIYSVYTCIIDNYTCSYFSCLQ